MTHAWLFTGPPGSGRSNAALRVRRGAAVRARRRGLRRSATTAAPRWPAATPTSRSSRTDRRHDRRRRHPRPRPPAPRSPRRPAAGRCSSSRTPTASPSSAGNALLKAIEEPPPAHGLDAVRADRSRTSCPRSGRAAGRSPCARPDRSDVAAFLVRADGVARGAGGVRRPRQPGPHRSRPGAGARRGHPQPPPRGRRRCPPG